MTASAAAHGVGSASVVGGALFPDALEANRAGQLTDAQRRGFAAYDRSWRRGEVGLALVFVVLAALLLSSTGPAPNASLRPFAGVGFLVLALAVAVHAMPARDPLARDLRSSRVESLEAAMEKHTFHHQQRREQPHRLLPRHRRSALRGACLRVRGRAGGGDRAP